MSEIKYTRKKVAMYDGNYGQEDIALVRIFDSVHDVADYWECDKKHIYRAISYGKNYLLHSYKYCEDLLPNEEWVFHPNGRRVSNMGRTQGKSRGVTFGCHRPSGYMVIYDGNRMYQVHRLVLEGFTSIGDGEGKFVDHIDGNKTNNTLSNLRWVTAKENASNRRPRQKFKHCDSCSCEL